MGIICTSLPLLKPLIMTICPKLLSDTSSSDSGNSSMPLNGNVQRFEEFQYELPTVSQRILNDGKSDSFVQTSSMPASMISVNETRAVEAVENV